MHSDIVYYVYFDILFNCSPKCTFVHFLKGHVFRTRSTNSYFYYQFNLFGLLLCYARRMMICEDILDCHGTVCSIFFFIIKVYQLTFFIFYLLYFYIMKLFSLSCGSTFSLLCFNYRRLRLVGLSLYCVTFEE